MKVYNKDGKEIYINSYDELKDSVKFFIPGKIGYTEIEGSIYLGLSTGIKRFSVSSVTVRYENKSISSSSDELSNIGLELKNGNLIFWCTHTRQLPEWNNAVIELLCNIT